MSGKGEGVTKKKKGTCWKWWSRKVLAGNEERVFWMCLRVQKRAVSETVMQIEHLLSGFVITMSWLKKNQHKNTQTQDKIKKSRGKSSWLFFCMTDHKQSLVKAVSITIQICMPCFWLANSSPPWGDLWETFWKYKCEIQKTKKEYEKWRMLKRICDGFAEWK